MVKKSFEDKPLITENPEDHFLQIDDPKDSEEEEPSPKRKANNRTYGQNIRQKMIKLYNEDQKVQ